MSDRLVAVLNTYLEHAGDAPSPLGKKKNATEMPEGSDEELLWKHLARERTFNNRVFLAGLVMLAMIFVLGVLLVASNWGTPNVAAMIFGGTSLSLAAIQRQVFKAWSNKVRIDLLIVVLPGLNARERLKAIQDLVYVGDSRQRTVRVQPGQTG